MRQHYCYWGNHCTVQFVFCVLRHIVVLLLVSFVENFHCIFGGIFQSCMSFTLLQHQNLHKVNDIKTEIAAKKDPMEVFYERKGIVREPRGRGTSSV
jgi:hypothetical protein